MSENFSKKWGQKEHGQDDTLTQLIRGPQPLKPRLDLAIRKIDLQISRLDQANERFTQKDKVLFTRLVDSYEKHDMSHANMYAIELAEIRKMSKLTMNARLALDQVSFRIKTVSELGDVVSTLGPCLGVLRGISLGMGNILPEAENELGDISNLLNGLMYDAGTNSGTSFNFGTANEDASKILAEAAVVAEQKMNANFPEMPSGMQANSNKSNL